MRSNGIGIVYLRGSSGYWDFSGTALPSGFVSVTTVLVGQEGNRGNRTNIKSAKIVVAAQIEALEGRRDHAAVSCQERSLHVDTQWRCDGSAPG